MSGSAAGVNSNSSAAEVNDTNGGGNTAVVDSQAGVHQQLQASESVTHPRASLSGSHYSRETPAIQGTKKNKYIPCNARS
jgi:hypothetical protein